MALDMTLDCHKLNYIRKPVLPRWWSFWNFWYLYVGMTCWLSTFGTNFKYNDALRLSWQFDYHW